MPSFCPSLPHQGQNNRPACHFRASGEWIPFKPMILGDSVGGTTQKKWMSFGELWGGPSGQSTHPGLHGHQSQEGQWKWPSPRTCEVDHGSPCGQILDSAFWSSSAWSSAPGQNPFQSLCSGSPSGPLPEASCLSAFGGAAPTGSCLTPWLLPSQSQRHYLPVRQTALSFGPHWRCRCLWHGQRGRCRGTFPNCSGQLGVVTKRAARDMFPVSNCRGYMSTLWASGGQACKAAL